MKRIKNGFSFAMILVLLFVSAKTIAINYTITFSGSGASTTVGSVIVQNLTKGTSVIVPTGSVLNLTDQTDGVEQLASYNEAISVYPTPEEGKYTMSFYSINAGVTQISIYSIDGRKIAGISTNVQSGLNSFKLTLPAGLYAAYVSGVGYAYSKKIISQTGTISKADITYLNSDYSQASTPRKTKAVSSVIMNYNTGDRLLYKGVSGNLSTIVTDIPTTSKTTNFEFVECKDANNNYYSVVKIGTQTWMAENLKATKYRTGDDIVNLTNNSDWGMFSISSWCSYSNDLAYDVTGKLYNWYAVSDSRNVAPLGWHVASDAEWTALTTTLGGETIAGAKLKETGISHWTTANAYATNESGFTAFPGGYRLTAGTFDNLSNYGYWWSSSENTSTYGWYRYIYKGTTTVTRDYYNKNAGFSIRCVKDADLPTLTTATPSSITYTTAIGGGNISSDGGAPIIARGVCWSTTANPTTANNKTVDGTGIGVFSSSVTGLNINTTYYVRAYATNSSGTAYGTQITFNSAPYDATVTDADGNLYHAITIGTQTWMVENLKTTKYRNGDVIGTTSTLNMIITSETSPKYQWAYNGIESNVLTYGRLYTWYVVADPRNLAPAGWHIPTDEEWTVLTTYLGGESITGGKLKEMNLTHWTTPNTGATNETGFFAVPSGYRRETDGLFYFMGDQVDYWTSTMTSSSNAWDRVLCNNIISILRTNNSKSYGFSVRCMKNSIASVSTTTPTAIMSTTATCGGNVIIDGGETVTESGICWNTTTNPTITNSKKSVSTGIGSFSTSIAGLTPNTTYYVRAYATNNLGTAYGPEISFKTYLTDPVIATDQDGNVYHVVTIGTQTWMVENLKTTKYRNGDPITNITDNTSWVYTYSGAYCWYNNDIANKEIYGAMYNGYTIQDTRNIAPAGWHVPYLEEWTILSTYLGGDVLSGAKMKESGITHWITPNTGATNESGFTALPGGARNKDTGAFTNFGLNCFFWNKNPNDSYTTKQSVLYYDRTNLGPSVCSNNYGESVRCIKNSIATVSTTSPTTILSTSATCGGNVTIDGGETVTEYGICWNTSATPTIANSKKSAGAGIGSFSASITGLTPNTTYYVRAYATNSLGTAYGPEMSFKTLLTDPITVTDVDGNVYHTVTIGTQTWMVENLKTTKYNDGTAIPLITDGYQWTALSTPGYCWINNNINNKDLYGGMYNFYAVNTGKLAPTGWHVPTESDWLSLSSYLGGFSVSGSSLKEAGAAHWSSPNSDATNSSGFTALPGGYRTISSSGGFMNMSLAGCWWSATMSNSTAGRVIFNYNLSSFDYQFASVNFGFSVRCIKN